MLTPATTSRRAIPARIERGTAIFGMLDGSGHRVYSEVNRCERGLPFLASSQSRRQRMSRSATETGEGYKRPAVPSSTLLCGAGSCIRLWQPDGAIVRIARRVIRSIPNDAGAAFL